jgi:hypothetical protein
MVPPEYARWVEGEKIQQYSLQLTFPFCDPKACLFGGFTTGFTEGVMSAIINTM